MDNTALIAEIRDHFKEARKHSAQWRACATESYKFIAGGHGQWQDADVAALEEQGRPVITFNRIGPYLDAVSGMEIGSRHTIKFLPRTVGDARVNEVYTAAIRWVRDNCNAEDEESDAFVDVLACGMGWMETAMDYETEHDGKIIMNRVDPAQMFWDPRAKKRNLEDRRWQARSEWFSKEEIEAKWPKAEIDFVGGQTPWLDDPEESGQEPHNASLAFLYKRDQTGYDDKSGLYRVIHYQWYDLEKAHRLIDPATGRITVLSDSKWQALNKKIGDLSLKNVPFKQRIYREAFICCDKTLEERDLSCKSFTFKPITGKRNKIDNTWYGLVENMKDPQRWSNKFFSQILHIINSNAKGGLIAETGAFTDPKKAEEQWADPTAVVLLKNGGLAKIKERDAATYPQGLDRLMSFAVSSIPAVSGVNLESMGLQDREQAGILEQERKKATFTVLAPFFDSLRRYRKEQGRLLFSYINEYISDGRLIRITTDQGEQWAPLNRQDETLQYDIIVEESPQSPNQKQEVWQTMSQLIPPLLKAGMPLPPDFFDYSPLPTELAQKMKASMEKKLPPQVEELMNKMREQVQKLTQENQAMKQDMQLDAAKIQSKDAQAQMKNQLNTANLQAEYETRLRELESKNEQAMNKLLASAQEQQRQFQHEMALALLQARSDATKESASQSHERVMQMTEMMTQLHRDKIEAPEKEKKAKSEKSANDKAFVDAMATMAGAMKSLNESIKDSKPSQAKKIRDKNGELVAAEVTYQSGDTRRITIQ